MLVLLTADGLDGSVVMDINNGVSCSRRDGLLGLQSTVLTVGLPNSETRKRELKKSKVVLCLVSRVS
jgi:hypothetical protein